MKFAFALQKTESLKETAETTNRETTRQFQRPSTVMKTLRRIAMVTFLGGAFAATQPAANARDQVPFRASYGLELETVVEVPFAAISSTGTAFVSHLGRVSAHSVEETVNLATGEGLAIHQFIAANGDAILLRFAFVLVPTTATDFAIDGVWEIIGGTGRFAGASGSGTYFGHAQFSTPSTATAEFELIGKISSPGGLK